MALIDSVEYQRNYKQGDHELGGVTLFPASQRNLTFAVYQVQAARTMKAQERDRAIIEMAMGLSGEAGEVLDAVKKIAFHGHALDKVRLAEELGDVTWYLAAMATVLDLSLGSIAEDNITKLMLRYPRGFSEQRSREREE